MASYTEALWASSKLTGNEYYCLYEKIYDGSVDPTDPPFCGNCWRSIGTNKMCYIFFIILATLFCVVSTLMAIYLRYRILTTNKEAYGSYYIIFAFILTMLGTQTISLSDVFFNYGFTV